MKKTILFVDDSPTVRNLAKSILQGEDKYEIYTAQDGEKALKMVEKVKLDLIITDINMPNMDGIELIAAIRHNASENSNIPILVVTTEGGSDTKNKGKVAGASGWITKPFEAGTLVAATERLLSR